MTAVRAIVCGTLPIVYGLVPIARAAGIEVIGLWESIQNLAEKAALNLKIDKWDHDLDKLLDDPTLSLVLVCTSPYQQSVIIEKALNADKQVLCALPCCSLDHRWVQLPPLKPKGLFLGHPLRFLPAVRKMRHLFRAEQLIGRLQIFDAKLVCGPLVGDRYDWSCDSQMGGGILNLYGAMLLDLVWHLTRRRFASLDGMRKTYTRQTPEICGIRKITADDFCLLHGELEDDMECGETNYNNGGVADERTAVVCNLNCHAPVGQFDLELTLVGSLGRLMLRGSSLYYSGKKEDSSVELDCIIDDPFTSLDEESVGLSTYTNAMRRALPPPCLKGWSCLFELLVTRLTGAENDGEFWESAPSVTDWDQMERNLSSCDGRPSRKSFLDRVGIGSHHCNTVGGRAGS